MVYDGNKKSQEILHMPDMKKKKPSKPLNQLFQIENDLVSVLWHLPFVVYYPSLDTSTTQRWWFTFGSHACFRVNRRFFLILTQLTTTVWSFLLLWCRVPPITKSTRKWWPLETWERDPVYPEQNPYSWSQPSPAPGPSDMPSIHTLVPSPTAHTHTHKLAPLTQGWNIT